jgi:hypothetical protein
MTFRKASAVNPLIQLLSYLQSREDLKGRIKHIESIPAISAKGPGLAQDTQP